MHKNLRNMKPVATLALIALTNFVCADIRPQIGSLDNSMRALEQLKAPVEEQEGYWGYHLILDCKGCNQSEVVDPAHIANFVKTLVNEIEMKAYGDPLIEHFATGDLAGYSLVQLIETSSITGHFVDINGDAYIDIFSCKRFDVEKAKAVVAKFFHPQKIKSFYLTRQA